MSYDREKALAAGYIVRCQAALIEPVTISGTYKCTEGHAHHVRWGGRTFSVSSTGYDYAFLGALDDADDAALARHSPETRAYWEVHARTLTARGYGAVALPLPPEDMTYPG
jgi:hypothetical protein